MFGGSFKKIQNRMFFATLLVVLALFVWMVLPYAYPLVWAAILASLFHPLYEAFLNKTSRPNVSAGVTTLVVLLAVVIPISLIVAALVREAVGWYEYLSDPGTIVQIQSFIEAQSNNPFVSQLLAGVNVEARIESLATSLASTTLFFVRETSLYTVAFIAKLFIMLYVLFYFLRDGEKLLHRLERLLPFGDKNERKLFQKFTSTSRATLKGTILLSIVQGVIGGVFFSIVGLPSVVFFTILMIFFSIIPALGAFVVLGPAIVYLLFTAPLWQAVVLALGAVLVNISDNLLRPYLVGHDIEMHPALILLATVGGLAVFGISGIVFGPVIAAFTISFIEMYEERYKRDIDKESRSIF